MQLLDRVPPPVLAVAAIVSVQFGSASARTLFDETGALGAATLRLVFGSLILLALVRPRVRSWDRRTWITVAALGLALAGMNCFIYLAIDEIPIGIAVTVEFLGPLAVALSQVRKFTDAAWALLAFAGVLMLGFEATSTLSWVGLLFAAVAAVFWAAYILASSRLGTGGGGLDTLAVAMVVAAIVATPFGAASAVSAAIGNPSVLIFFVGVALATSALPYTLEFVALGRMPTRVFGVLSSLGPAVAAIAGLVILGEQLGWLQILALVLVSVASLGVSLSMRRPRATPLLD
ncbi:EamA family transporter [Salinibacterium sp. ZJ454]|uniref:EamA family transporter n=1 Tax=Salinibacterium sp. ZJ454 TaxID=2708339 RepID=UPI001AB03139|nr:EamA family transporter [Salinibacterium sp. ZJ454]